MQTSESIAELTKALVAAQKEFKPTIKANTNPAFRSKYADLATVIDATQEALLKNGLLVMQSPGGDIDSKTVFVTTRVAHTSGEWMEGTIVLPGTNRDKFDPQSVGSAITYARRYSLMGILGIAAEDDDGNAAAARPEVQRASANGHAVSEKNNAAQAAINHTYIEEDDIPLFDENGQIITRPAVKPITQIAKTGQFDAFGENAISDKQVGLVLKFLEKSGRSAELPGYLAKIGISELARVPWKGAIFKGLKAWAGIPEVAK